MTGMLCLTDVARKGMKGVAERAGGAVGGHVGFAMQAPCDSLEIIPEEHQTRTSDMSMSSPPPSEAATISTQAKLGFILKGFIWSPLASCDPPRAFMVLRWISFFVLLALGSLLMAMSSFQNSFA